MNQYVQRIHVCWIPKVTETFQNVRGLSYDSQVTVTTPENYADVTLQDNSSDFSLVSTRTVTKTFTRNYSLIRDKRSQRSIYAFTSPHN